ncbi:ABC-2 type transport system permease protein [Methanofollis sp. W23]|uniref:ABC transporter permease n=1 Tax=Methanofollis sp. W23 TaxID=2817849 RepID=UPI001AE26D97|nr:ABC transporter permease [Methanofollis sp. W23]MBP2146699.1 ABC-2 type transport system permease protein [Methanofollis sp. W23]
MRTGILRIIAGKEFRDQVRSKRFRTLFAILLIIAVAGLIDGAFSYQEGLERYNEMQVAASEGEDDLSYHYYEGKPSVLEAFNRIGYLLSTVAAVLGIAMGFDLITAEKESKSLKILLSHPVYRDEVITGKALGGAGAIALAMGIMLLVSLALMLVFGIVPNFEETVRILLFGVISFLGVFTFFAIALFMSTVARNSGNALIGSLAIFIVLGIFLPSLAGNGALINALFGDRPEPPQMGGPSTFADVEEHRRVWDEYQEKNRMYQIKVQGLHDTTDLLSPTRNYMEMVRAVADPRGTAAMVSGAYYLDWEETKEFYATLPESGLAIFVGLLGALAKNIIAMLVLPVAFFGLAWVRFAREDIR